jgi:hypothetical protein
MESIPDEFWPQFKQASQPSLVIQHLSTPLLAYQPSRLMGSPLADNTNKTPHSLGSTINQSFSYEPQPAFTILETQT